MEHHRDLDMHTQYVMLALTNFAEKFSQIDDNKQTFNVIEADGDDDNSLSSFNSTSLSDADDVSLYYDSEDEDDENEPRYFILDHDSPLWGTRDTSSSTPQLFEESFAPIEEINHLSDTEFIDNILKPIMNAYKYCPDCTQEVDYGLFKHAMYSFVVSCLEHCNCNGDMTVDAGRYINWIHLSSGTRPDEQPPSQASIQDQPSVAAVSFQEEDTTSESGDSATSSSQVSVADLWKRIHGLEYENKKCKAALKRKNVEFVDLSEASASKDNSAKRPRLNENEAVSKSMAKVKQEEDHKEDEEEEEETSDGVLVVGTSTTSRVTRASVASTIRQVVKREDPVNGSIRCPDRKCNMIIPFTNGGCNVLTCRGCFGYFCVHCYKPCEENYSTCGCSKRITHDDLVEAQQLRNERSRENPVLLD